MKRGKYFYLSLIFINLDIFFKKSSIIREITASNFHKVIATVFDMEVQTMYAIKTARSRKISAIPSEKFAS